MALQFYEHGALLEDADLDQFEARVGVKLPPDYRRFLKEHNGGRVRPRRIPIQDGPFPTALIQYFLSINGPTFIDKDFEHVKDPDHPRMPPEHIPIAECEGGDYLTLVIDGPRRGQIFYWNHEEEGDETYTYDNLYFVAGSIEQLLASLT
jgi:hypothetical protein